MLEGAAKEEEAEKADDEGLDLVRGRGRATRRRVLGGGGVG